LPASAASNLLRQLRRRDLLSRVPALR
jgi:hypothetical protein